MSNQLYKESMKDVNSFAKYIGYKSYTLLSQDNKRLLEKWYKITEEYAKNYANDLIDQVIESGTKHTETNKKGNYVQWWPNGLLGDIQDIRNNHRKTKNHNSYRINMSGEEVKRRLIDSGLIYTDRYGNYYTGTYGDLEVNEIMNKIIYIDNKNQRTNNE